MSEQVRLTSVNDERVIGHPGVVDGTDGYVIDVQDDSRYCYRFWGHPHVASVEPFPTTEGAGA